MLEELKEIVNIHRISFYLLFPMIVNDFPEIDFALLNYIRYFFFYSDIHTESLLLIYYRIVAKQYWFRLSYRQFYVCQHILSFK